MHLNVQGMQRLFMLVFSTKFKNGMLLSCLRFHMWLVEHWILADVSSSQDYVLCNGRYYEL